MTRSTDFRSGRLGSGLSFERQRSGSCASVAAADENMAVLEMIEKDITAGFAAFLALTFHSVIEGLSIGTQEEMSTTISIAIAIICHKGFAAFALGCTLTKVKQAWIYWTLCGIFCVASPMGTAIGIVIQKSAEGAISSLLSAFCGGTLFFVGADEIVAPALSAPGGSLVLRLGALWLGFAGMAPLAVWA